MIVVVVVPMVRVVEGKVNNAVAFTGVAAVVKVVLVKLFLQLWSVDDFTF